jgi:quinoprotein dehydrogenase-associated probable ABC transporter substrate-binding protein
MSFPFRSAVALGLVVCSAQVLAGRSAPSGAATLRVCADPNNLPFSNDRQEGFENRLAEIVARDLHQTVAYTWWAERRGFVRNTLSAGACDAVMGVPSRFERTLTTRPYYRSAYVFVTRRDSGVRATSLDDPVLRQVKVGVQLIGDDGWNSPPAHALAERRIVSNVVGFPVYGNYLEPNPPARIVEAVSRGDVDVAVAWGPLAGFFAARSAVPLRISSVGAAMDRQTSLPLAFDISVGVAKSNRPLRDRIDSVLLRRRAEIARLLTAYHVPTVP